MTVAVGSGVSVGVLVGVGISVAVDVGLGVSVAVAVGSGVSVAVAVAVGAVTFTGLPTPKTTPLSSIDSTSTVYWPASGNSSGTDHVPSAPTVPVNTA